MAHQRIRQLVVALALVTLGWAAAKAQTAAPDFELLVNAPTGEPLFTAYAVAR